ncbi:MAG TPA: 2-phospho-L-lactate guanylyltransferase [Ktedonobacteraceae bacterium]|nr:2-phospho-L-lactate guanylyltransferase [Ktedonobacteraceae bacterium]
MKYSALVPVKKLALAKGRLASHLSPQQREMLVLDMLYHVICTLCESEAFEQIYVVSSDPRVLELAQYWGAEPLAETQQGHNPALLEAARTIVERTIWRQEARVSPAARSTRAATDPRDQLLNAGLLTISADLPLLTQEDIFLLMRQAEHYEVVLAASSDGSGTNALLTRPPLALPYLFGPHSLAAYTQAAQVRRISYTLIHTAHLAFDIDTLVDLQKLACTDHTWSRIAHFAVQAL